MTALTIFYDHQCSLCYRFRRWLDEELAHLEFRFISYRSPEARQILPEIDDFKPGKEIVVLADNEGIYQGADTWIIYLWATRNYREWADCFAAPSSDLWSRSSASPSRRTATPFQADWGRNRCSAQFLKSTANVRNFVRVLQEIVGVALEEPTDGDRLQV